VIAFRGVVEHHVEDHFKTGGVQVVDHGLKLADLPSGTTGPDCRGVAGMRSEKSDGVITPVIGETTLE
jgi:hypothetical protein